MGIWGEGRFENDTALDFKDGLLKGGLRFLSRSLHRDVAEALARAARFGTPEAIEATVEKCLANHRAHLAAGLKVGPEDAYEARLRASLEAAASEPQADVVLSYAAAVEVLHCTSAADLVPLASDDLRKWASRNRARMIAKMPELLAEADEGMHLILRERGICDRAIDFVADKPAWYAQLQAKLARLRAL